MRLVVFVPLFWMGCVGSYQTYHAINSWREYQFEETGLKKVFVKKTATPLSERVRFPEITEKLGALPKNFVVTRQGRYGLFFKAKPQPDEHEAHFTTSAGKSFQFVSFMLEFTFGPVTRLHLNFICITKKTQHTIISRVFLPSKKDFHQRHSKKFAVRATTLSSTSIKTLKQSETDRRRATFLYMDWVLDVFKEQPRLDYTQEGQDGRPKTKVYRSIPVVSKSLQGLGNVRRQMKAS